MRRPWDGIAVAAEDTTAPGPTGLACWPWARRPFSSNTGHPLPAGTNAVIMIEQVQTLDGGTRVQIESGAYPWQHVRKVGEDIVATQMSCLTAAVWGRMSWGHWWRPGQPRFRSRPLPGWPSSPPVPN